ncbi:MAG: cation-transporting P-type ATPase [Rhodospirillales bacterium]|nr:cation-transporting P-type ATPase [Rhodospirillales bacterium]
MSHLAKPPYLQPATQVLDTHNVQAETGLTPIDVRARREKYGSNKLRESSSRSTLAILIDQFRGLIVYLLVGAVALSFYFGDWTEGGAITAVLLLNAAIGFTSEYRAVKSMESLRKLSTIKAKVLRSGNPVIVPAQDIVPGDIVLLEAGDVVPADIRLIECTNLQCDESALTGESVPTTKISDALSNQDIPLGDRINMVFKGTSVTRGDATGVAIATGMATELGHIADMTETAESDTTPLEKRLDKLGGQLIWVTLGLTLFIAVSGIYVGKDILLMVKTGVALAIAAVPEGLPIVATVALARGMARMARRNALIKNLSAVETLGATTVIMTDKTGTLTENHMTAVRLRTAEDDHDLTAATSDQAPSSANDNNELHIALKIAVLCNDATLVADTEKEDADRIAGDPMEVALLEAGKFANFSQSTLLKTLPEIQKEAFSPHTRMMATYHQQDDSDSLFVAVKGAPEAIIQNSSHVLTKSEVRPLDNEIRQQWEAYGRDMTADGLRVLALAMKETTSEDEPPYENLVLVGLIALLDPPRSDVKAAMDACHQAGIRTIMVTGDHAGTALSIARQVGLCSSETPVMEGRDIKNIAAADEEARQTALRTSIFARVSPEMKLDLVSLHQSEGAIVAMTGDGVNDAPALKKANIGVAMGQRGTEVAREAADMVLRDDAFPSIVAAMRMGRVIFANIRTFVIYLMSCNLSEILIVGLAVSSGLPLPLLPLQILYLNLVTDVFPAFALGIGEGSSAVMKRPPRDPREPILAARHWTLIVYYGGLITVGTLGAFVLALYLFDLPANEALSVSFLTLAIGQLFHVFNMRNVRLGWLKNDVTANPFVWAALAICAVLIGMTIYVPSLSNLLSITAPSMTGWLLVIGGSLTPLVFGPLIHFFVSSPKST